MSAITGMARKRHVYREPWPKALRFVGSEAELERLAESKQTLSDWRKLGVPADVLLPITIALTDKLLARGLPLVESRAQRLPEWATEMQEIAKLDARARGDLLEVLRDLRVIQARDAERFGQVRNLIHAQRALLEPPVTKRKRKSG